MMTFFFTKSTEHLKRNFNAKAFRIGRYESHTFADGEKNIRLLDEVRNKPAALVASLLPDPASLFELLVFHRILYENGASHIKILVPYFGYARQDRPSREGEGGIGVMLAELLRGMAASKIVVADLHSNLIRKALGNRMTEISAAIVFHEALSSNPPEVIISPDAGSRFRAEQLARLITPTAPIASIEKVRPRPNVAVARKLDGDVQGKNVLVIDDIIDTGGTLQEAVKLLRRGGARRIRVAATHGVFSAGARDRLYRLPIEQILVTNTLPQLRYPKIKVLNIVPHFIKALKKG
jgi:ribose-phosphate pyrophosphokinase